MTDPAGVIQYVSPSIQCMLGYQPDELIGRCAVSLATHEFDLVLSYTGGRTLDALRERLGARRVAPLYGSVDPAVHRPAAARETYAADLSYLGTCSADRDRALRTLFVDAAERLPHVELPGGVWLRLDHPESAHNVGGHLSPDDVGRRLVDGPRFDARPVRLS